MGVFYEKWKKYNEIQFTKKRTLKNEKSYTLYTSFRGSSSCERVKLTVAPSEWGQDVAAGVVVEFHL